MLPRPGANAEANSDAAAHADADANTHSHSHAAPDAHADTDAAPDAHAATGVATVKKRQIGGMRMTPVDMRRAPVVMAEAERPPAATGLSVVMISHNEGEQLLASVDSLLAGLPGDAEIIVVDDASTDGSAAALAGQGQAQVTVLRPEGRLGAPAARNYGAVHSHGEFLVFADAHVRVPQDWVTALLTVAARPEVGLVGPAVSVLGEPDSVGFGQRWQGPGLEVEWLPRRSLDPYPVPLLGGCFMAMRREVWAATGGFDPGMGLWGQEDTELSLRLWTLGFECWLVPGLAVAHLFRSAHPYRVTWEMVLAGILRLAVVHFNDDRIRRVAANMVANQDFPAAFATLAAGDAWEQRRRVRAARPHDDDWFFSRFGFDI
jgi:GT2 family glycosyltransferase